MPETASQASRRHTRRRRLLTRPAIAWPLAAALALVVVAAVGLVSNRNPARVSGTWVASDGSTGQPFAPAAPSVGASASASPSASASASHGTPGTAPRGGAMAPPIPAPAGKRWALSFSEEFNGTDYDHSKLTPCFDWNSGDCTATFNQGREYYQPSQVKVSNGTAKLIAQPAASPIASSSCQNGSCTYVAGLLSTARARADGSHPYLYKFTYGFVESRFKFPATQGFFTAFWMLPASPSYTYNTEIDILELLGDDPTSMFMTYSYGKDRDQSFNANSGKHNNGACPAKDYSKGFVDMGLDWEPNHIAWYIDGVKCAEFTNASQIESGPMQLILHMMVDNNWQRRWNVGLTNPTLVRQLEVDYIRVYQQRPAG
jgi:Glycosyl hydrolases family 16